MEGWFQWQHATPDIVDLPSGGYIETNKWAGQGEVWGSTTSTLVLGSKVCRAREELIADVPEGGTCGFFDLWYVDDGQAIVRPWLADAVLKAIDRAITSFGGSRATGDSC